MRQAVETVGDDSIDSERNFSDRVNLNAYES